MIRFARSLRFAPVAGLLLLLLGQLATRGGEARAQGDSDAWIIEGEGLSGSKASGTEINLPRITHRDLRITAKHGRLDADRDLLFLYEDVIILDPERVLEADQGTYRRSTRRLDLVGNVHGRGPEGRIQARQLSFDRATRRLELRGEPSVRDSVREIWADRIDYRSDSLVADAEGRVRMLLVEDSTWVFGEHARYRRKEGALLVWGAPYVRRAAQPGRGDDEGDLVVHADTLFIDEASRDGQGYGHVRITRGAVKATAERATFQLSKNRLVLYGHPVAVEPHGEIRADTMSVSLSAGRADLLRAYGNVRVHYVPEGKADEENLAIGDTLLAHLRNDAITRLEVLGDAVSIYLPSLEDSRNGSGRNVSRARKIVVEMDRGQANTVVLTGGATGVYVYPSDVSTKVLRRGSAFDSLRVSEGLEPAAPAPDSLAGATPPESLATGDGLTAEEPVAPEISRRLAHFGRTRALDLPDSLILPLDRLFDERVSYQGDTIEYHVRDERIDIRSRGKIEYRESALESREIQYLAKRDLVVATGDPVLKDRDSEVKGVRMQYRTDERVGFVYQGKTAFDRGFYSGKEVKKLAGNELVVRSGDYTTCDQDPPHYDFLAREMKLIQNDKVVGRPVVLRIHGVPVFALPYFLSSLKKGRHSGLTLPNVELGFNKNRGRFLENLGYYWAINDYMDASAYVDYYEADDRLRFHGDYDYKVRYLLDGNLYGSFENQHSKTGGTRGYSLTGSHRQTLGEQTNLSALLNFTSNLAYRQNNDFGTGVDERLNRQLKSNVDATHTWSGGSLSLRAQRTEYLDATTGSGLRIDQQAPSLDLSVRQIALGKAPDASGRGGSRAFLSRTYLTTSWAYRNVYSKYFDGRRVTNQAARQSFGLTDTRSFGSYLRLSPSVSGSAAYFREDARGQQHQVGASWSAAAGANTTLYGTFGLGRGPITALRHVIEPSVSYSYAPRIDGLTYRDTLGVERSRFPGVGGISLGSSKQSSMSFQLSQGLHAKLRRGNVEVKKQDVLRLNTGTSYNFEGKDRRRRLSTLSNSLRVRPGGPFEIDASTAHNPYSWGRLSFDVRTNLLLDARLFQRGRSDSTRSGGTQIEYGEFGDAGLEGTRVSGLGGIAAGSLSSWSGQLSHSYRVTRGSRSPTNTMNLSLSGALTPKWKVSGSGYLDLHEHDLISHSFTLYRDLHCWEAHFQYSSDDRGATYSFLIKVKQIPEVKYERQQR